MKEILQKNVISYMDRIRRKDAHTRQVFEDNLDFAIAIKSEAGQALLSDLITRHEHIFTRIASITATDAEKETYLYINGMLRTWCSRIAAFERQVDNIKEMYKKGDKV
jgi:esterase/lipase superfamily enzyme